MAAWTSDSQAPVQTQAAQESTQLRCMAVINMVLILSSCVRCWRDALVVVSLDH
jgi:hypothetical protein